MTERTAVYDTGSGITGLNDIKRLACALPVCHENYIAPKPHEVDALIRVMGWSQRQVALITGVNHSSKGSPTVRRWKTSEENKEYRQIPNSAWQLLLVCAGILTVSDINSALIKYHPFLLG